MSTPVPAFHRTLYCVVPQPPQAVQAQLERLADAVLAAAPGHEADPLRTAQFRMGSEHYRLVLRLLDVLPQGHLLSLELEVATDTAVDLAGVARRAASWLDFWVAGAAWQDERPAGSGSARALQAAADDWGRAERLADDVAATQRAIVEALRRGATLSTAHKEGGTVMRFDGRHFVRADYGESNEQKRFAGEAEFLDYLRRFFDVQTSRHGWPQRVPEAHAWRVIQRQLREPDGVAWRGSQRGTTLLAVLVVCSLAAGLSWAKWHPCAEALRAGTVQQKLDVVTPMPPMPPMPSRR